MKNVNWIEIEPVDTLFFRGTESMVAGENHEVDTMFPPMPSTIIGALRTALLVQNNIAPGDYLDDPEGCSKKVPMLGTPATPGFSITGPLFRIGDNVLYPAPAHWMADIPSDAEDGYEVIAQPGRPLDVDNTIGLKGSVKRPFWVRNPVSADMKPLSGYWVNLKAFKAVEDNSGLLIVRRGEKTLKSSEPSIIALGDLFVREERVGIALNRNRTVREGHLFSTVHVRLKPNVFLLVGIESDCECSLKETGIMQIGGEQRGCSYRFCDAPSLPEKNGGDMLYALSHIPADIPEKMADAPRASSGKLVRSGGWDMEKKFHKPLMAFLPAGTVISKKDCPEIELPNCITI